MEKKTRNIKTETDPIKGKRFDDLTRLKYWPIDSGIFYTTPLFTNWKRSRLTWLLCVERDGKFELTGIHATQPRVPTRASTTLAIEFYSCPHGLCTFKLNPPYHPFYKRLSSSCIPINAHTSWLSNMCASSLGCYNVNNIWSHEI